MEEMKENKKQNSVLIIYMGLFIMLISGIYYAYSSNQNLKKVPEDTDYTYVSRLFDGEVKTVVKTESPIIRPYENADVKVLRSFYDYKDEESTQENSIINYDTTYIQNNGIIYGGLNEDFDIRAIQSGKVTSIKEDKLMGKIVTIEHINKITSIYSSLSEVTVKENDEISQGTIIGKSGESNLEKDLGSILMLEVTIDGKYVNPEDIYDKQISDIKNN